MYVYMYVYVYVANPGAWQAATDVLLTYEPWGNVYHTGVACGCLLTGRKLMFTQLRLIIMIYLDCYLKRAWSESGDVLQER